MTVKLLKNTLINCKNADRNIDNLKSLFENYI